MDECGHYKNWKTDFQLVTDLGLKVLRYGLPYDLNWQPRPVADAYRRLLKEFGQITIVPHGKMFEITSKEAR